MRIWYDTEFVEDGRTIDLLSIGMVAEDGRELYRVNDDPNVMQRAIERDWIRDNVVKHLPVRLGPPGSFTWSWNQNHPDAGAIRYYERIRGDVLEFIRAGNPAELWAWYAAYDHVAYAQLFGKMIDLPDGCPMWTNDLRQEVHRLGNPELPISNQADHHALADARELRDRHLWLDQYQDKWS